MFELKLETFPIIWQWIQLVDADLFRWINIGLANRVTDTIMPIVTSNWFVRSVFVLIVLWLAIFGKRAGRITAVLCVVTIVLSDQLSSQLIKPAIARLRPCHVIDGVNLLVGCGQGYSFPSSHAVNAFAQGVLLSLRYPRATPYALGFAFVVAISRVFVGVHYPLDVLSGMAIGAICALLVHWLASYVKAAGGDGGALEKATAGVGK